MSDKYFYQKGAIHHDHKKTLNIEHIDSKDLDRLIKNFFKDDAEEAEVIEEIADEEQPATDLSTTDINMSNSRREMFDRIMGLIDKGDWVNERAAEGVRVMMSEVLHHSEVIWQLLENGRGDRVKLIWLNLVGYLEDKKLLKPKGAPALTKDFFGNKDGYSNIDKGRPSRNNMSSRFHDILPILDQYMTKIII